MRAGHGQLRVAGGWAGPGSRSPSRWMGLGSTRLVSSRTKPPAVTYRPRGHGKAGAEPGRALGAETKEPKVDHGPGHGAESHAGPLSPPPLGLPEPPRFSPHGPKPELRGTRGKGAGAERGPVAGASSNRGSPVPQAPPLKTRSSVFSHSNLHRRTDRLRSHHPCIYKKTPTPAVAFGPTQLATRPPHAHARPRHPASRYPARARARVLEGSRAHWQPRLPGLQAGFGPSPYFLLVVTQLSVGAVTTPGSVPPRLGTQRSEGVKRESEGVKWTGRGQF